MLKLVRCAVALEDCQTIIRTVASVTTGLTIYCMRENSAEMNRKASYRGLEYEIHLPGAVIEIVTDDSWADEVISKITKAHEDSLIRARTIQILPVEESYRIRDGFMDMR